MPISYFPVSLWASHSFEAVWFADKHPDCAAVPPFEVMRKTLRDPLRSSTRLAGESLQITGCGGICKKWLLSTFPIISFIHILAKRQKNWIVKKMFMKPNNLVQLMQCFWLNDTDKICCMMMRKSPQGKQRIWHPNPQVKLTSPGL